MAPHVAGGSSHDKFWALYLAICKLSQISTGTRPSRLDTRQDKTGASISLICPAFCLSYIGFAVACCSMVTLTDMRACPSCIFYTPLVTPRFLHPEARNQGSMSLLGAYSSIGFQNPDDQQLLSAQMRDHIYGIRLLAISPQLCAALLLVVQGCPPKWFLTLGLPSLASLPPHLLVPLCAPSTASAMVLLRTLYRMRTSWNSVTPLL